MEEWIISITIATLLFVIGQIYIKKSFNKGDNFKITAIIFGLFLGLSSLLYFCYLKMFTTFTFQYNNNNQILNAAVAGAVFFFGNLLWIYCISKKIQLGNIRTFMAGFEMFLLFCVGVLLFNDTIKIIQIFGVLLVLSGIYCISL